MDHSSIPRGSEGTTCKVCWEWYQYDFGVCPYCYTVSDGTTAVAVTQPSKKFWEESCLEKLDSIADQINSLRGEMLENIRMKTNSLGSTQNSSLTAPPPPPTSPVFIPPTTPSSFSASLSQETLQPQIQARQARNLTSTSGRFICSFQECGRSFDNQASFVGHVNWKHGLWEYNVQCLFPGCMFTYRNCAAALSQRSIAAHQKAHHPEWFKQTAPGDRHLVVKHSRVARAFAEVDTTISDTINQNRPLLEEN
ncbi:hypothetical protein TWF281_004784 [Arthrobotrys megalospora]